jgi:hypothetical protein
MTIEIKTIFRRLRRKMEVMQLDAKVRQDAVYHDVSELLSLLDILEREVVHDNKS